MASPARRAGNFDKPRPGLGPHLLLAYIGITWPLTVVFGKFARIDGIPPISYTFYTMLGCGLVMALIAAAKGEDLLQYRRHLKFFLFAGLIRVALPNTLLYVVILHIPVGIMTILMTFSPMIVYVLALAIGHERFVLLRFTGLMLGFIGAALIVLPKGSLPSPEMVPWVLLGFGPPLCWGVAALLIERRSPPELSAGALVSFTTLAAAAMLLPLALVVEDFHVFAPPITPGEWAAMAHIVVTAICFFGQFALIRVAGSVFTSQLSYIAAFSGILWGIVLFAESHSVWVWSALALVLGGLALVNRKRPEVARP